MTRDKALKVLHKAVMYKIRKQYAFDAGLYRQGIKTHATTNAHNNRKELLDALKTIELPGQAKLLD